MDAIIDEALALGNREVGSLALNIRDRENENRIDREDMLRDLGERMYKVKHPPLRMSDIVTVVEAAPDEEAQLQTVLTRLAKRGEWDPLVAELAIATVGPQDMDALINFLESLTIEEIEHSKAVNGKSLVKCVACEEELQPKDLVLTTCGHCYCGSCLNLVFNAAISDESLYPPSCCAQTPIPIEHAERFLDAEFEKTFEEKGVKFSTVDRTYCSDPTCSTFIPQDDYVRGGAFCPKCSKRTCVACKAPGHEGDCPTDLELAALLNVVQRRDGCNHMECRCGAAFCYTCGRELSLNENVRCPCQNLDPPPYNFYRRPADLSQPPDSPRTIQEDGWDEVLAIDWGLPEPDPTWDFPEEDGEDLVHEEPAISRAGTPDMPHFVSPQAANLAWDTEVIWDNDILWDFVNGEQASIAASRYSLEIIPDTVVAEDVTSPDPDATLLPVTSNATIVNLLRQLVTIVSAEYPVLLNQDHENGVPASTSPASLRGDLASNHLSIGSDEDSQHSRSQDGEDVSEYKASDSSTISMKPTRRGRLRTKLSPHRLLRVLRKAGMSALCRKGHASPSGN
ncbi:hypothetical protein KCU77_g2195, partial [Aureobasidium melanogenum]